uniref:C2H2-type domain-containing protein n=1 Tax=Oryza punctata TaxID=4537 RepID=A0A0E0LCE3_ORYPU
MADEGDVAHYRAFCKADDEAGKHYTLCEMCLKSFGHSAVRQNTECHYGATHKNKRLLACSHSGCKQKFLNKADKGKHEYSFMINQRAGGKKN